MNKEVYKSLTLVLIAGSIILFTSGCRSVYERLLVEQRLSTMIIKDNETTDGTRTLYGVSSKGLLYDEDIIMNVRNRISQPSTTRPRKLFRRTRKDSSQYGQSTYVDKLLFGRRNGFFVECGAADGETISNSLFFELQRNWTGILIEVNAGLHHKLLQKNRRAYVLKACLSPERRPVKTVLRSAGFHSGIIDKMYKFPVSIIGRRRTFVENCFPLNTIMAALTVSQVDYFSLDVEGAELDILRTIDWSRLHIDVMTVEYRIYKNRKIDETATLQKLNALRDFFFDTGIYREMAIFPSGNETNGVDVVFSRV